MGRGENVEEGEEGVDEADFFVADEGEDSGDQEGGGGKLVGYGFRGGGGGGIVGRVVGGKEGGVDSDDGEGEESCEEEGKAFCQVVVPPVFAVEDGEGLGDVEVEKAEGGKVQVS